MEKVRKILEELGWPDGRSLFKYKEDIIRVTSFLDHIPKVTLRQRLFCIYDMLDSVPKCKMDGCDNECKKSNKKENYPDNPYSSWTQYCSQECAYKSDERMNRFETTMLERHGVRYSGESEELRKKMSDTVMERYGVDHQLKSEEIKRKVDETHIERYGARRVLMTEEGLNKKKETMMERYGVEHPSYCPKLRKKAVETLRRNYGVDIPFRSPEIKNSFIDSVIGEEARILLHDKGAFQSFLEENEYDTFMVGEEIGVHPATINNYISIHDIERPARYTSRGEDEVAEYIQSLGFSVKRSDQKTLGNKRHLDILVEGTNIAIEYNGVYWHSCSFVERSYHKDKSVRCEELGIQLFHIWSDEWEDDVKRGIIKTKLAIALGVSDLPKVPARKTVVRDYSFSEVKDFMDSHHIQGAVSGSKYIGCDYNGVLIAVMVLKKTENPLVWDLTRFCSSALVQGGFSKMLSFFKKTEEWEEIVTFADRSISDGGLYEKSGFKFIHDTAPILWYVKNRHRYRRELFMKHKLPSKFPNVDMSKTEKQILEEHKYFQLFDAGLKKYSMKREA